MGISQIKSSSDTAHDVIFSTVSDDITATGTTDIVNVTETGRLIAVTLYTTTAIGGGPIPVVDLEIVVDGGTTRTIALYDGATLTWTTAGIASLSTTENLLIGESPNDRLTMYVGTNYAISLRVSSNVTTASNTGAVTFGVLRGVAL